MSPRVAGGDAQLVVTEVRLLCRAKVSAGGVLEAEREEFFDLRNGKGVGRAVSLLSPREP